MAARRSRDGSMPSSSARTIRVRVNTSSASACRPALNRAVISWPTSRSRVGAAATMGCRSAATCSYRPSVSIRSARSPTAARCSSVSRAAGLPGV